MDLWITPGKEAVNGASPLALVRNALIHLESLEDVPAQKGLSDMGSGGRVNP